MYLTRQRIQDLLTSPFFLAPAICLISYVLLAKPADLNYFKDFAVSILHGRLNIERTGDTLDLVSYHGKLYIYWPPAPTLIFLPLVAIWGQAVPDELVSCVIGACNVWLAIGICKRLSQRFSLGITPTELFCIGIFWGLGTVHFYMAKVGYVWQISQIIAQCYLLLSLYFFVANRHWLLPGLFWGLAVYSRNNLVFSMPFFLLLYIAKNPGTHLKAALRPAFVFFSPFFVFSLLNCWYNYTRFGSIMDNGLNYHLMSWHFTDNFKKYGYASWHYLAYNFYIEVIHFPTFLPHLPFIEPEEEGFGFIWASPLFLLLFPALFIWVGKIYRQSVPAAYKLVTTGCLVAATGIAIIIFMIMGTGWVQFGARYTLDFYIFLVVFLLFHWQYLKAIPTVQYLGLLLLILSVAIETVGAFQQPS